ncbi:MAG: exo-alpha-sialidase [Armatimonadetes bacterium]|nr:exo-alpha-sialidase [Armatimonadota bacterium]
MPKTKPDVVIYEGSYPGWPWIATSKDGTLYCVFREGTEHDYSAVGRAMITHSVDRGQTWSKAKIIIDEPDIDDRNVAITVLPGGELLVAYNTYTAQRKSQAVTVRSADKGSTWTKPEPVGDTETRTRAAAVVLSNGDLLLPYYIAPGSGAVSALSRGSRRRWETARVPDTEGFIGDEWDALEVEPGRIVGIIRNSHPFSDGAFWKTESRDGGRTWAVPRPTNLRSERHTSPAQITRHGKRPVVIYSDRRMVSVSAARTSDPEYLRWDDDRKLPCYLYNPDESPILDGSYPCSVHIDAHRRLIVDYDIRPEAKRITGYFVEFPEDWGR